MSQDTVERLQAELRAVFGPGAGVIQVESEREPDSPRSGEPDAPPYLDDWTHGAHPARKPEGENLPVPCSVGDAAPWGGTYTEVGARKFLDGSIDLVIIERPHWYQPGKGRRASEKIAAMMKRDEHMDPEHRKRSAQRAKVSVRRACSQIVSDRIGTLTFHDNVCDVDESWSVFAHFRRLYVAELPYTFPIGHQRYEVKSFDYVCVPEPQKRGAVHFHLALNRPHDINRLRRCWQEAQKAAGLELADGNVNIRKAFTRQGNWSTNSRKCARYISKYLHKNFSEGYMFRKRYSVSQGIPEPELHRFYFIEAYSTSDLIAFAEKFFNVECERQGCGKAGPFDAAYATLVPP